MTDKIVVKANAKINLSLNVMGITKGMHLLDMVLTSIDAGDMITLKKAAGSDVRVTFEGADISPFHNTAYKAAKLMQQKFDVGGLDVHIVKNIPLKGGLGGSSADASGVIAGVCKLYGIDPARLDTAEIALTVGSDVPYQLQGGLRRVTGFGQNVMHIAAALTDSVAVISGGGGVDTGMCFGVFDKICGGDKIASDNDKLINALTLGAGYRAYLGNALTESAALVNSRIKDTQDFVQSLNLDYNMSGSGDSFFVISADAEYIVRAAKKKGFSAFAARMCGEGVEIF